VSNLRGQTRARLRPRLKKKQTLKLRTKSKGTYRETRTNIGDRYEGKNAGKMPALQNNGNGKAKAARPKGKAAATKSNRERQTPTTKLATSAFPLDTRQKQT
jgi:hypothetical protein